MTSSNLGLVPTDQGESRCVRCIARRACLASRADDDKLHALPGLLLSSGPISKGKYLYRAGDPADGQVHLRSGMVKTYAISAEGNEYVTGFHLPGDVLGCAQKEGRHAESAIALELSTACLLSEAAMDQLGQMGGGGLLWQQLAQRDALGIQHQINLTQTTSQARYAGFCTANAQR